MAKKLHYFDINGLGEGIRFLMHYGKQKFEDIRYDYKTWPIKSVKNALPYGQLPLYEEGNRSLNQSLAIARYIGFINNLVPNDPWEQAVLDAAVYTMYDFWSKLMQYVKEEDPAKKQMMKKEIMTESVHFFFSRFDKELMKNKGHFGGKLTWADFVFVGIIEAAKLLLGEDIEKKYTYIVALMQKVKSLPGIKEYVASRKPYVMP